MLQLNGKTLPYDKAFTHNGMQYPANWLRLTSLEEKQAIGIVEVSDPPAEAVYDQRFYWGVDNPKQLDDGNDAKGNPVTGLKTLFKQQQDQIAQELLSPSDWRVVKAAEVTDYAVASKWLTYRAAVRTACNARQAEIDATKDVPALKELLFGSEKIEKDGEMIANPALATAWPTPIK